MDRRSWLCRRKSSEKSPGETESSGSISSERYSDDHQENLRASPNNASPNYVRLLEVSSKVDNNEVHETVKSLAEKLSAALLSINAKEDLVKQHAKVAEEAVSGTILRKKGSWWRRWKGIWRLRLQSGHGLNGSSFAASRRNINGSTSNSATTKQPQSQMKTYIQVFPRSMVR